MPGAFTRTQIDAVAALALLELDDADVERLARQLAEILDYVRQVQGIDTAGVPPTATVGLQHDVDRDDQVTPSLARRDALANAPDAAPDGGLFKVPRVVG